MNEVARSIVAKSILELGEKQRRSLQQIWYDDRIEQYK